METKMITIPFEVELAKKIQDEEHPGKIIADIGEEARIICFDRADELHPIVALVHKRGVNYEDVRHYTDEGDFVAANHPSPFDLRLQVPEWTQYKEGDIISYLDSDRITHIAILRDSPYFHNNKLHINYAADFSVFRKEYYILSYTNITENVHEIRRASEAEADNIINLIESETDEIGKMILRELLHKDIEPYNFQPFEKVLVKHELYQDWDIDIFKRKWDTVCIDEPFECMNGHYRYCIPYNEQTKHLLGTTDNWEG